jgi:sigma-B regulation protein RsbU (phosphoserine phosphatase)
MPVQAKPSHILIVDDMPANLSVLTSMLNQRGYLVRPAISGPVALKAAQKSLPDLILLDIMMPGMDGYEVCEQLKENPQTREIPVIFISALSDILDKVRAFNVGGVDYITKPFQAEEVLARVQTHLALRATQQQLQSEVAERQVAEVSLHQTLKELQILYGRIQDELTLAREIQYSLLPPAFPNWPDLKIACYTMPAREIGGDFYTYYTLHLDEEKRRYAFAVGDVSGKGVSAALLMVASLAQFDASISLQFTPAERLAYLDRVISPYTQPRRQNCALCYVELALGEQAKVHIVNAGCIPPYIKRKTGEVENSELGGFALGQGLGAKRGYQQLTLPIAQGDLILLVSDGAVEAHNSQKEMFGFDRLLAEVQRGPNTSVEAMLDHLKRAIFTFTEGAEQNDDLTIVVVQV